MNQPSDEAMAAAYELVCATREGGGEIAVTFGDIARFFNDEGEAEEYIDDLRFAVAAALDDHTAALRAEVEALRAQVEQAVKTERARIIKEISPHWRAARDTWVESHEDEEGADAKYAEMKAYETVRKIIG